VLETVLAGLDDVLVPARPRQAGLGALVPLHDGGVPGARQ
jgi:hypothetical protein